MTDPFFSIDFYLRGDEREIALAPLTPPILCRSYAYR